MESLRKILHWRKLAIEMYFRTYGRRCVRCSKLVKEPDAALYYMATGELLLVHQRCEP